MLSRQRNEWGAKIALQIDFELSTYQLTPQPLNIIDKNF
jgi:hypothetical protein